MARKIVAEIRRVVRGRFRAGKQIRLCYRCEVK